MLYPISLLSYLILLLIHLTHASSSSSLPPDTILLSTRHHWLRYTLSILPLLSSPCPFAAFGTVIVNHTATSPLHPHGKLICIAVNQGEQTGNAMLHGEVAGILNCTEVLGREYGLSPEEVGGSWKELSLYSSAEPCVMCAAAIRWMPFKECIYGTTVETLVEKGWSQFSLSAKEVFERSGALPGETRLLGGVLANETDPWFSWQFDESYPCPSGCERRNGSGRCRAIGEGRDEL